MSGTTEQTDVLTVETARAILDEVKRDDPAAICPTPAQLVEVEAAGLTWNFDTGQAETECVFIGGMAIPIAGTIGDGGRVQLAPWFTAKMGGE